MKVTVRRSPFNFKAFHVYVEFTDDDFKTIVNDDLWGDDVMFDDTLRLDLWGEKKFQLVHDWLVNWNYPVRNAQKMCVMLTIDDFVYGVRRKLRLSRMHKKKCFACTLEARINPWFNPEELDVTLPTSKVYQAVGCALIAADDFLFPPEMPPYDPAPLATDSESSDAESNN